MSTPRSGPSTPLPRPASQGASFNPNPEDSRMAAALELISQHRCFGGSQRYYRHDSAEIGLPMRFSVFVPPQVNKAGAGAVLPGRADLHRGNLHDQGRRAARRRRTGRDAGGAGHQSARRQRAGRGRKLGPGHWRGLLSGRHHARLEPPLPHGQLRHPRAARHRHGRRIAGDAGRAGICGHSMGGHGALVLALRNPGKYRSVSAFAPIAAPAAAPGARRRSAPIWATTSRPGPLMTRRR